ncbi:MAG TPA: DUF485 domain-containing protein [Acetobacteraceae bacterium]|nr:DUF485 domain-containing protein [Acetobacteraceae bacterium]
MDASTLARIRASAAFTGLEHRRSRFAWSLTVLMLAIYLGFLLLVAFGPGVMGTPVAGVITVGFPVGVGVILSAIVLTGIYVFRANTTYDALERQVRSEVR